MAPLAAGGRIAPGHPIGARTALALDTATAGAALDATLLDRVQRARVRCARRIAPVDTMDPPSDAEWRLGAAVHDVLQSANPSLDGMLRSSTARRVLDTAIATLERVPPPETVREALSRHTWLARVLDVARTDTDVSWWTGSKRFLGVVPPARLQAWPELRRVAVTRTRRFLLELEPLAVERERLVAAVALLLERTPLTSLATCTRAAPAFAWSGATLGLVATRAGQTLAARALDRLPAGEVDAVLERATRELVAARPDLAPAAQRLVSSRSRGS